MRTDRAALVWGTVIAIALVMASCVLAFDFPGFQLRHAEQWIGLVLVSIIITLGITRAYRRLWKRLTFWLLFVAFLAVHVSLWWFLVLKLTDGRSLFQQSAAYAIVGGAEVLAFAGMIYKVYQRGPDAGSFTR